MTWLVASVVLSVLLTVILNVGARLFPDAGRRTARRIDESTWGRDPSDRRIRVWAPWKAMILASVLFTIVLNLVLWIAR